MTEDRLAEIEEEYADVTHGFEGTDDVLWLIAEVKRLREEMAEWESAHAAVVELRGLVESHMDMARGEWECVATIERLRAQIAAQDDVILAARATVGAAHSRGNDIECQLVSGLHDALRRAGLEPLGKPKE